jgi:hypothetical protein
MKLEGGCQCGDVRYRVEGEPLHAAFCHCTDCRKSAGAPVVAWGAFNHAEFEVLQGDAAVFNSSGTAMRHFCPRCGTGLWYTNAEYLPGIVDIQIATLDDPEALPPGAHIQVAERVSWMKDTSQVPEFARYPGG